METPRMIFLKPTEIEGIGKRYHRHPGPFAIDRLDLDKIFPGISKVKADPISNRHLKGDADPPNLALICALVRHLEPAMMLELGTFRGKTAFNMAFHSPPGSRVITVDFPAEMRMRAGKPCGYGTDEPYVMPQDQVGALFRSTEEEGKITQLMMDITDPSQYEKMDSALRGQKAGLAFIDASHDYESVKTAFEQLVLPRMREGGLVIFDDYMRAATHPGVTHFLLRKAHDEGYVFYPYLPMKEPQTNLVLFLNLPESRGYDWRSA